jgi:hypothetical protein
MMGPRAPQIGSKVARDRNRDALVKAAKARRIPAARTA